MIFHKFKIGPAKGLMFCHSGRIFLLFLFKNLKPMQISYFYEIIKILTLVYNCSMSQTVIAFMFSQYFSINASNSFHPYFQKINQLMYLDVFGLLHSYNIGLNNCFVRLTHLLKLPIIIGNLFLSLLIAFLIAVSKSAMLSTHCNTLLFIIMTSLVCFKLCSSRSNAYHVALFFNISSSIIPGKVREKSGDEVNYMSESLLKYPPFQCTRLSQQCFHLLKQSWNACFLMFFNSFVTFALMSQSHRKLIERLSEQQSKSFRARVYQLQIQCLKIIVH
ncbi:hypothetical protein AGLY_015477 [Aphis glycines]|uniref:Uncharacterized protein n=1 Tax=Aphis glycines TaxID=307491 RepID=A0A6G0T0T0_APHGL|nr:hypothetical protein AGLY_015477 [Aphis glycines]